MTGKVLNLDTLLNKDEMGCRIANHWMQWDMYRAKWKADKEELRKYVYATDTTQTTNSQLPWKNKTTVPKLCQIRDNLYINYILSLFPRHKWLDWYASHEDANEMAKRSSILNYMTWAVDQERFKLEIQKCVLDFIDYGNAFCTIEWVDERQPIKANLNSSTMLKAGYIGPTVRRINPLDIVFNPTAPSFLEAPKIVRSIVSIGEVKKLLEADTADEDREANEELFKYLRDVRLAVRNQPGADLQSVDKFYQVDGFTNFRAYLESDYCELLTFYGDIYDWEANELLPNHKVVVVDRHKIISKKPNPSYFGYPPIFHVGWRPRQDNLWAMGPLDNLIGLQYRLDHVENLKADVFDLLTFPPLKVKGYVEDFKWGPMERIVCGEEGDVEMVVPAFQILTANSEIQSLMATMEEMAGAPKEAMGFRTPGEKTLGEVTQLSTAASRIFQGRINQFSEMLERACNGMLELSRRSLNEVITMPVFDDEFNIQVFMSLTPEDITGAGRLKPMAARHFAEKAEMVQNLNTFYASGPGQDPEVRQHVSSIKTAEMLEDIYNWGDYGLVQPYVRVGEQADAARLGNAAQEQVLMESQTPTGLTPDDHTMGDMPMEGTGI